MTDSSSLYLTSGSNIYVDGGIISGAYIYGDGSNLINIPASGVTGLQLNQITSGSNSASIDLDGFNINTNTSVTGSLNVSGGITGSVYGTSSYAIFAENAVIVSGANKQLEVISPSNTWSFTHNLHERYPVINVFDSNGYIVVPETIRSVNQDTIEIYFNTPEIGTVVASVGGAGTSGTSGTSGSDGSSGTSGVDGVSGTSGTSGTSGSSGDSLFALTGSHWNTTNNVQITGSLDVTSQLGLVDSNLVATDSSSLYLTSGSNLYIFNGQADLTNSDLTINTGDLTVNNGTISGSFVGDGAGLYNIPYTGITGLQLDRIVSGDVSASLEDGTLSINTDVNIDGILTAKELHIDYVTSSILYQSGSTKFGDTLDDTHQITGSLHTTGSVTIDGDLIVNGTTILRTTDPLRDSLIISGALAMVHAQIQAQIVSASISMGGQKVISQDQNNIVMDLGGF
jgi:hypothetical protein